MTDMTDTNMAVPVCDEPILTPANACYTMFPIQYNAMWDMYQKAVYSFWQPGEISLTADIVDWDKKLNADEKHFISMILAFFAASDGLVMENLAVRFMADVQISEARAFYAFQIAMENIHSHTYSILIDTLIQNGDEKERLFGAMDTVPCIQKKADWCKKWMHDDAPFATRMAAFACVEGIFFSGSFCSIFWLKQRGLMPGLCFSNELISRDEALHCEFAILMHEELVHKCPPEQIIAIITDAVTIEKEFICDALPCKLIGINADLMKQYIEFVANRLAVQLGVPKLYPAATNPFPWMERISMQTKTNFFEQDVSEYALATTTGKSGAFDSMTEEIF